MLIQAVHLRRFRGLRSASLEGCAGLNVLIGRNNSGKSTVLAAIETALEYSRKGRAASIWKTRTRPEDEFTNRETDRPVQIGITFHIGSAMNEQLRSKLLEKSSGLDVAIDQLRQATSASVIFAIEASGTDVVVYVQDVGLGYIDSSGVDLLPPSVRLMSLSQPVAHEFAERERNIAKLRRDLSALDRIDQGMVEYAFREKESESRLRRFSNILLREGGSPEINEKIESLYRESGNLEKFNSGVMQAKASIEADIDEIENSESIGVFNVFSGSVKKMPPYIPWLLQSLGEGTILSFKEVRPAIGRDEAGQLLRLKTKRGGAEALARIQTTVRALLGVKVDAFEPENQPGARRTPHQDSHTRSRNGR